MLSFGEQLYRPTAKDEETLLVEPLFRELTVLIPGASQLALWVLPIPIDRSLYIERVSCQGFSYVYAGNGWAEWFVQLDARFAGGLITVCNRGNGGFNPLISDGVAANAPNAPFTQTVDVKTVYPPGMATVRFNASTPAKAVDASVSFTISGYLIPPGRIGRR